MIVDYKGRPVLTGMTGPRICLEPDLPRTDLLAAWRAWASPLDLRVHGPWLREVAAGDGGAVTCRCGDRWICEGFSLEGLSFRPTFEEWTREGDAHVSVSRIARELRAAALAAEGLLCLQPLRCAGKPSRCPLCEAKWHARRAAEIVERDAETAVLLAIETHEADIEFAESAKANHG